MQRLYGKLTAEGKLDVCWALGTPFPTSSPLPLSVQAGLCPLDIQHAQEGLWERGCPHPSTLTILECERLGSRSLVCK